MNLITDPWLPVLRKSSHADTIAPWQLTEVDDPIVAFNAPRPDFDGALWQFAIGLLQTCVPPEDHAAWLDWLEKPPDPAELQAKLSAKYLHAFEVEGKRGSFMQDFEPLEGESKNIAQLLIDMPGANTLKENTDHFVKRGGMDVLCPSCAVMALFTLQTNAPSGGAGHRVSLRGGGPLTTLVTFDDTEPPSVNRLWSDLWLNVLDLESFSEKISGKDAPHDIFPWLATTRTSSKKDVTEKTTLLDVHPLQMYWGMPRRIRVGWQEETSGKCDMCDKQSDRLVSEYKTDTYGVNYVGGWRHSLSPYYNNKKEWLPQHLQSGGASYKDWLGLVVSTDKSRVATVVRHYEDDRKLHDKQFRLYVFGYDMDNMKARCWYETKFPLFKIHNENFSTDVQSLIEAADECINTLIVCIKEVWFPRKKKKPSGDTSFLKKEFYQRTQNCFYRLSERCANGKEDDSGTVWHKTLQEVTLSMFDRQALSDEFVYGDPQAIVNAKNKLVNKLKNIKKKLRA